MATDFRDIGRSALRPGGRYRERVAAVQRVLRSDQLGALLVTSPANIRYLSGFNGSNGWLLVRQRSAVLLTDVRYREQARQEAPQVQLRIAERSTLTEELHTSGLLRDQLAVGFERDHITYAVFANLDTVFDDVEFVETRSIVEKLRRSKGAEELRAIRKALRITEQVFDDVLSLLRPGVSEKDISAEISYRQRLLGAERDSFPAIVLGGVRTSLVHGQPSSYRFRPRDLVLMDFGCVVDGYCSDMTRMAALGEPRPAQRRMVDTVFAAQAAGVHAVRAGVHCADIDALVRSHIDTSGLGQYFEHALGHGVGVDIHEAPTLSSRSGETLSEGDVVTIEPGVYVPRRGGVRLEDMMYVGSHGAKRLTSITTELRVL